MKEFKEEHLIECINKQFEINGYIETYNDVKSDKNWLDKFETNMELENKFREFLKEYFKQFVPKYRIDKEIGWFILSYGLPCKNYNLGEQK